MLQGKNRSRSVTNCLIAVGSNLVSRAGDSAETVRVALGLLAGELAVESGRAESGRPASATRISRLYRTPAFPPGAGPDFVNAAIALHSPLAPEAMLARLHDIEGRLGRRRNRRWEARTIDLDLLACDDMILPDATTQARWMALSPRAQARAAPARLILPHPRLHERAFVLLPLADIAPDWRHPVLGRSVRELVADLPAAALSGISALGS